MVNLRQELKKYSKIDVETMESNGTQVPENIKSAVAFYNKALESMLAGNEDIAIIELKKAISNNPDFHQAQNLLGICYAYTSQSSKAQETFGRVIQAEANGAMAYRYMCEIDSNYGWSLEDKNTKKIGLRLRENISKPKMESKSKTDRATGLDKLPPIIKLSGNKFLTGLLIGVLVTLIAVIPFYVAGKSDNADNDGSTNAAATPATEDLKPKVKELEKEIKKLKADIKNRNSEINYYKNTGKLLNAENLFQANNYTAAAEKLLELNTVEFKGGEKEKYNSLKEEIMPKAAEKLYYEGESLYKYGKYEDALEKYKKIQAYARDWDKMDAVLYKTGACYKQMKDYKNAIQTYQRIIEEYPQSYYKGYATSWVNYLSGIN